MFRIERFLMILSSGALLCGMWVSPLYAMGSKPSTYHVAVVSIDPAPFKCFDRRQDYDLWSFPATLRDTADNTLYEVFTRGGGHVRKSSVLGEGGDSDPSISAFYREYEKRRTHFILEACAKNDPMVNVLVAFTLSMDPAEITRNKIRVTVHAFYLTREGDKIVDWHRSKTLELDPSDSESSRLGLQNEMFKLISEYKSGTPAE